MHFILFGFILRKLHHYLRLTVHYAGVVEPGFYIGGGAEHRNCQGALFSPKKLTTFF